jgi:NAD(P)-dependent dehydrogenase (short-subunit alcohol dehydrogenase family)
VTGQVVITGAAGGIGAALAEHFLRLGRTVTGLDITPFPDRLAQAPGFTGLHADIADEAAVETALDAATARGPIAALLANAAVTDLDHHDVLSMPYATWARILRVNVDGAFLTARGAARRMERGNIVFVTSSLARLSEARANDAPYCTSKAAVEMLARVMALELAPKGINVNTLYPSVIVDTGFFARWTEAERRRLSPPTILNASAAFLADLAPGAATGRSLDQDRWDRDEAYRAGWGAP